MKKISALAIASAIASLALTAGAANAQPTFANFAQTAQTNKPFEFKNAGASSQFGLFGIDSPTSTSFFYQVANSYGAALSPIDALMTFTSDVDGVATTNGIQLTQKLKNVNISFTAVTPVGLQSNLLTVYLSEAYLTGLGNSFAILATDPPLSINYTSDFMDVTNFDKKAYSLGLTTDPGVTIDPNNGYLSNFKASMVGNFAGRVPEPGTMGLLALGAIAGLAMRRRK